MRLLPALLFLALAGCSQQGGETHDPDGPPPAVSILEPATSNRTAVFSVQMLKKQFPEARWIASQNVAADLETCLGENRVLIVPDVEHLPMDWLNILTNYLGRGGPAVFLGLDPFKARVRFVDGVPQTESELFDILKKNARSIETFSPVGEWQREHDPAGEPGPVFAAANPDLPWPGIEVDVKNFFEWDLLIRDNIPKGTIRGVANSLVFYARGGAGAGPVTLECTEQDGSCWAYSVPVTENWLSFVVHEARFYYRYGGTRRGGAGDRLMLSRIKKISVGLSQEVAAQAPGRHSFGVSDFRLATDPRTLEEAVGWPDLFLLSPPVRHYNLSADELERTASGQKWAIGRERMQSPFPLPQGMGGETGAPYRWIPLFNAVDKNGSCLGFPASICIEPQSNRIVKKWAWIGADVSMPSSSAIKEMILACARRLGDGLFLYKAGCSAFSFKPESFVKVTARWTGPAARAADMRVCTELHKEGYDYPLRRVVGPSPLSDGPVTINLGRAPAVEEAAVDYTLRITLEDANVHGKVYDHVDQPLKFLTLPRTPREQNWITASGARFVIGRRPVFLLGINYSPPTPQGWRPGEFSPHWLDSAVFDPLRVQRDLDQLANVGINAVSIQYLDPAQGPQLKVFLEEARKRGIWVHLFVAGLSPFDQDLERARRLIKAADLQNAAQVFALDLAWEPRLGRYRDRSRFDRDWENWLVEQYGTVEHAAQVIGRPIWTNEGRITGPSDKDITSDGSHRVAVEAYRRFADDFVSRRYGQVVRWLRQMGIRQLVGARTGWGGTGNASADAQFPLDPASGAVHLDFISPEGWELHGDTNRFFEAGFITAYGRGVSGGKPVLWVEFGSSVGAEPRLADLANQARIYRNMFEMAIKSRAAGCFGSWYPSGFYVGNTSDRGIVNPDGTLRPAGEVFYDVVHRLRKEKSPPAAYHGREVDRGGNARGLSALWDMWRDVYRREMADGQMQELRPLNFGKQTREIEMRSVGGAPYLQPAPPESLNAEWGLLEIDGVNRDRMPGRKIAIHSKQKLRMELINTGPATWDGSEEGKSRCVWVQIENEQAGQVKLPVESMQFGDTTWISWIPPDSGTWRARPLLSDVGPFGEPLEIEVLESENFNK